MIDRDTFRRHVREALGSFYDPAFLQTHPLAELLVSEHTPGETHGQALRQVLSEAIEELRPPGDLPFGRPEWRPYRAAFLRYVECMEPEEAARELGLGRTSLYRCLHEALEAIESILWERLQNAPRPPATSDATTEAVRLAQGQGRQPVALRALLEGVEKTMTPPAEQAGVTLHIEAPASLPAAFCDPVALRQAVIGALAEALEHVESDMLRLTVEASEGETLWRISGAMLAGNALCLPGLALCQSLLAVYGGRLWIDASGSVCFALPCARPRSILIVDDDQDTIDLYQRYLSEREYAVRTARDAEQAQAALAQARPDLILLDVLMPQCDGWELLQRLKATPETAQIPVIICSVLTHAHLAQALGADRILQKPVDQTALLRAVQQALAQDSSDAPPPTALAGHAPRE